MNHLPRLESETVFLRALDLKDAEGAYPNWLNDPEVTKFNSHGDVTYTKDMAIEYIKMVSNSKHHQVFAIIEKPSDRHIGNIALQAIDEKAKSAEFAILIGESSCYGKGIGEEAGRLLLNYGFANLQLHRIYCGTSSKNLGMQKLASKLGMKQEGIRRDALMKSGEFADIVEYGILEDEFKNFYKKTKKETL